MPPSIGTVGDAFDDALAETTIGLYKAEGIREGSPFRTGPLETLADLENITSAWVPGTPCRSLCRDGALAAGVMLQHVRDGARRLAERVGLVDDHPDLAGFELALAARSVMLRHPWAPRTVEGQAAPGPAALHYVNAVLGILREGGFSIAQTHRALRILGSRLLGFAQALFDDSGDLEPEAADALASAPGASHPYLVEMALAVTHGGALGRCDDDTSRSGIPRRQNTTGEQEQDTGADAGRVCDPPIRVLGRGGAMPGR